MIDALDIRVRGIVQGVGFRPFVYRLARRYLICGWVLNDLDGVFIHAEGESGLIDEFVTELHMDPPAAARITEVELREVPLQDCTTFEIRESRVDDVQESTLVSADLATCDECLAELFDPGDRRYRYPFINCTNCGPRFTIIEKLPYDREHTSMVDFAMCPDCASEYADPLNRRFHALPEKLDTSSFIMWLVLAGIAGARVCHVAEYWNQDGFCQEPVRLFKIWEGGLVFYGGLAGAVAAFFAMWARFRKERTITDMSDAILAVLPLGHAFGRMGCFFNGCCFGKLAGGAWEPFGVSFPPMSDASFEQAKAGLLKSPAMWSLPVLPTQLFEAVWLFALCALLVSAYVRTKRANAFPGLVTGLYFCGYSTFRFLVEFLRGDDRPDAFSLSSAQIFSVPLFALGAFFIVRAIVRPVPGGRG